MNSITWVWGWCGEQYDRHEPTGRNFAQKNDEHGAQLPFSKITQNLCDWIDAQCGRNRCHVESNGLHLLWKICTDSMKQCEFVLITLS